MNVIDSNGRWTEDVARRRLAEFERSRMSLAAFAARIGVSTQRFVYWRQRLGEPATTLPVPRFVELTAREPSSAATSPALEVRFPSGHVVAVAAGSISLAAMLELVEDLSC